MVERTAPHSTVGKEFSTPNVIAGMLRSAEHVSDLIFSPGRMPQVESNGLLVPVKLPELAELTAEDTAQVAADLLGGNRQA